MNGSARYGFENILNASPLCEASVLESISTRFSAGLAYSGIDKESIVSVNPYMWLPSSSPAVMAFYKGKPHLAPHICTQVQGLLSGIANDGRNRSVVITGESGSGKSVAFDTVLQYLQV